MLEAMITYASRTTINWGVVIKLTIKTVELLDGDGCILETRLWFAELLESVVASSKGAYGGISLCFLGAFFIQKGMRVSSTNSDSVRAPREKEQ